MKCVVCGTTKETTIEPRFGYVICPQHANLSPVEVSRLREKYNESNEKYNESK